MLHMTCLNSHIKMLQLKFKKAFSKVNWLLLLVGKMAIKFTNDPQFAFSSTWSTWTIFTSCCPPTNATFVYARDREWVSCIDNHWSFKSWSLEDSVSNSTTNQLCFAERLRSAAFTQWHHEWLSEADQCTSGHITKT